MNDYSKKDTGNEEEYQFPHDEYVHESTDSSAQTDTGSDDIFGESPKEESFSSANTASTESGILARLTFLRNGRVIGVIVLAVVVLLSFKIFHRSDTKVIAKKPVIQQPNPQVLGALSGIKQQITSDEQSSTDLKSQVQDLQTAVATSNQNQAKLERVLQIMAGQMQQMQHQITALEPHKKTAKKQTITFYTKAVIPGRAWVINNEGVTNTVSVGAKLKDYGVIKTINADTGVITTSSGRKIVYGTNDS